ncbi:uncharacterized protein LOC129598799 [Paramacrobiotus metropolitanus]|uniref:uncharacterized protein LOC129598799 n=1 Tax=Paramacrobiotus metropolitanus TaxID=2943436 RepID=UPI002445D12B|nr:uncharacterized protein LOC129598799 [Paramacrobiotus metropolitanus]
MAIAKAASSAGRRSFACGDLVIACDPLVWALERSAYKTRCAYCLEESSELRACSGCQLHRYCNSTCQAADWKVEHKLECAMLKKISSKSSGTHKELISIVAFLPEGESSLFPIILDMIAKLANKIKLNTTTDIPGLGQKSAHDLLQMLPPNPAQSSTERILLPTRITTGSGTENATVLDMPLMDFLKYYGIIHYNFMPVCDVLEDSACIGLALYPQASRRQMTPVCLDINVVLNNRGRQLVVHAVENIPEYTGLQDLRYTAVQEPFNQTRAERRAAFVKYHGYPCTCRKCTEEYDADVNPLKCVTMGCSNRIPSDSRARGACSECGALNGDRLAQFRRFMQQLDTIIDIRLPREHNQAKITELCEKIEAAGILQSDAHIRYVCGWKLWEKYLEEGRCEEGCRLMDELVDCMRDVYPKYEVIRAVLLMNAGTAATAALQKRVLVQGMGRLSEPAKIKLEALAAHVCCRILDFCKEAYDILVVLFGQQSKEARTSLTVIQSVSTHIYQIEHAFHGRK